MNYLYKQIAVRLNEKLQKLDKLRPFPVTKVKKLQEQFGVEMTYNSNAIEDISLTLKETSLVVNEGITVKGKALKDHLEANSHAEAISFLYDLIAINKKHTLSIKLIQNINYLLTRRTNPDSTVKFRSSKMSGLMEWLRRSKQLDIIELAAIFHYKLIHNHPFFYGNGRTARLVMNLILMQQGYPLVVILKNDRKKYYAVLNKADKGDLAPLVNFIAQAVERSLDLYIKALTPVLKEHEQYYPLAKIAQGTPYSAKYLNLLVRQGKLGANKQGRIWHTSKEALHRYIASRERKR